MRMTVIIFVMILSLAAVVSAAEVKPRSFELRDGDVVFQTSGAGIGPAMEIAHSSNSTHWGVDF